MNVMCLIDLEVAKITDSQFRNEMLYQTTMSLVKRMLSKGMISKEEYYEIDTIMLGKYQPIIGTLLWDISLL